MTRLSYDAKSKKLIKDGLYELLYMPVKRHYNATLQTIIDRNCAITGNDHPSFIYRGEIFQLNVNRPLPRKLNRLHPSLRPEMDDYMDEVQRLNNEELPYVLGYINNVLNSSDSLQDYFEAFPESVHKPIMNLLSTCGCREHRMTQEEIEEVQKKNTKAIELMKQRMVLNLIL